MKRKEKEKAYSSLIFPLLSDSEEGLRSNSAKRSGKESTNQTRISGAKIHRETPNDNQKKRKENKDSLSARKENERTSVSVVFGNGLWIFAQVSGVVFDGIIVGGVVRALLSRHSAPAERIGGRGFRARRRRVTVSGRRLCGKRESKSAAVRLRESESERERCL